MDFALGPAGAGVLTFMVLWDGFLVLYDFLDLQLLAMITRSKNGSKRFILILLGYSAVN
jgi:hypothetical protein